MLTKKANGVAKGPRLKQALASVVGQTVDRRTFLARSGLVAGATALAATTTLGTVKKAKAQSAVSSMKKVKSVCTHCAVGCTVIAEVDKGVWVGQEPAFESPINLGPHCKTLSLSFWKANALEMFRILKYFEKRTN